MRGRGKPNDEPDELSEIRWPYVPWIFKVRPITRKKKKKTCPEFYTYVSSPQRKISRNNGRPRWHSPADAPAPHALVSQKS